MTNSAEAGSAQVRRRIAAAAWAYLAWAVLTWTLTVEQVLVGIGISLAAGLAVAPLGPVAGPWELLRPRRLWAAGQLLVYAGGRIVVANMKLARRIWLPSRPLRSGMIFVETAERSDAGLTAVALVSSLIVDNQFVDPQTDRGRLQYHAMAVPAEPEQEINAPLERILARGRKSHD